MSTTDNFSEKIVLLIKEDKLDEAEKLWGEQKPQYVYKFLPLGTSYESSMMQNLFLGKLHFNYVKNFDDKEELNNNTFEFISEFGKKIADKAKYKQKERNIFCCFSGSNAKTSEMWEKYANNHNGIKCQFEVLSHENLLRVCYTDEKFKIKEVKNLDDGQNQINRNIFLHKYNPCMKEKKWNSQDEYRMIFGCEECFLPILKAYCNDQNVLVNKNLKLTSIEIGNKVSEDNKLKIEKIAKDKNINCFIEEG